MKHLSRFSPASVLSALCAFLATTFRSRAALQIEILALRHQLNVLQRSVERPRAVGAADRWFRVWLPHHWFAWHRAPQAGQTRCRHCLALQGVSLLLDQEVDSPKIHGELLKLGFDVSETTVSKYLVRRKRSPSTILDNVFENDVKRG